MTCYAQFFPASPIRMSKEKVKKPAAEKPRGFRDRLGADLIAERRMLDTIRTVYESYGFDPLETPASRKPG